MNEQRIEFPSGGRTFGGVLVEPNAQHTNPRPAVMVLHGGSGLGPHERERAGMLAERGYVAFAPDVFGEVFTSREHGMATITNLVGDPPKLRARLADALAWLRARSGVDSGRMAAIGYCFGGTTAFEMARGGEPILAAIGFHSGLGTASPAQLGKVKAKVLAQITPQGLKDLDDNAEIELHEREQFMTHARSGGSS